MTDRPRTWTLHLSLADDSPRQATAGGIPVRVVEWDRGRVVPIIEQAVWKAHQSMLPTDSIAEAVFDALNEADDGDRPG